MSITTLGSAAAPGTFVAAKAVWPAGREREKNLTVGFRAELSLRQTRGVRLRLSAATLYKAWLNGEFLGYGPARGPHGYCRIDEWDLSPRLKRGYNLIAIEVAGYAVNSYYTIDQPSFLRAEILQDGRLLAATGASGFQALLPTTRIQKVQRYSFQRPFSEAYRRIPKDDFWTWNPIPNFTPVACEPVPHAPDCLERRAPYPAFAKRQVVADAGDGTCRRGEMPAHPWKDRSLTAISDKLKGYPEADLAIIPSLEMQRYTYQPSKVTTAPGGSPYPLSANSYQIGDFGLNDTGFIGATVTCKEPTTLVFAFDEVLHNGDVDWKRLGCVNLVWYDLLPGSYSLESFEPYTLRYLKLICLKGSCTVEKPYLREYACSGVDRASFRCSDPRLEKLFAAGRETFRQNAVDAFMDCPSRERAGWLCDSFFTARVAPDLRGDTSIEHAVMENFQLPTKFEFLPSGMLPMCYPADHNDGVFIPNWALWFVVQLEEYAARSGDPATVAALKPRVMALFDYLRQFRNSYGLLEKLPSWVFIEWSAANNYVQDVNYPSNMLYAGALDAAGRLYGLRDLRAEAERIRETIRKQSFDGEFFVDNAVRAKDGSLQVTRNRTEVCQYYAFFFGVGTPERQPKLWATLRDEFGPKRKERHLHPEVAEANSFIGNMLRIELLSRAGRSQQILDESIDYLLYMADRTGTLWENVGDYASCNHGFASHIVHTLYRDVLGARAIDRVHKRLILRFARLKLEWCRGEIPTPDGPIKLAWRKQGGKLIYDCHPPAGYTVTVENPAGLDLVAARPVAKR